MYLRLFIYHQVVYPGLFPRRLVFTDMLRKVLESGLRIFSSSKLAIIWKPVAVICLQ